MCHHVKWACLLRLKMSSLSGNIKELLRWRAYANFASRFTLMYVRTDAFYSIFIQVNSQYKDNPKWKRAIKSTLAFFGGLLISPVLAGNCVSIQSISVYAAHIFFINMSISDEAILLYKGHILSNSPHVFSRLRLHKLSCRVVVFRKYCLCRTSNKKW